MSISRCGLQVSRDPTITNDTHDQPRSKQIGCLIQGTIIDKKESSLSQEVVTDELEDQLEETSQMKGEGFRSFLTTLSKIPFLRAGAESLAAGISNAFPDSDENARDIFPGEFHAIVKLPNEKFGRANFTGPGTRIIERLKRGDPPRVLSDKVSQAHDIRYGLAENEADVRKADEKMLRKLEQLKREGTDRGINITPAMIGIRGKILAENFDLVSRSLFINPDFKPSPEGTALMEDKLKELEMQGFGRRLAMARIPVSKGRNPSDKMIFSRNQVRQISAPVPRFVRRGQLSRPQPIIRASGPGPSATQQLVDIYPNPLQRGVPQVDRMQSRNIVQALSRDKNTQAAFANRNFQSDSLSGGGFNGKAAAAKLLQTKFANSPNLFKTQEFQRGRGQDPGQIASASSEKINIQQRQRGKGWPGVNPINVQAGSGKLLIDPPRAAVFPGTRLVKKIQKKIKKRAKPTRKQPIFMNDHAMAGFLADKMMPLVMAN